MTPCPHALDGCGSSNRQSRGTTGFHFFLPPSAYAVRRKSPRRRQHRLGAPRGGPPARLRGLASPHFSILAVPYAGDAMRILRRAVALLLNDKGSRLSDAHRLVRRHAPLRRCWFMWCRSATIRFSRFWGACAPIGRDAGSHYPCPSDSCVPPDGRARGESCAMLSGLSLGEPASVVPEERLGHLLAALVCRCDGPDVWLLV